MRTKTIIAAAAILAVSIATTVAQTNVYSQNVVGYINITVPAGGQVLIANQLNAPTNTLKYLIPNPPPGTMFYKWLGGGFNAYLFDADDLEWVPDGDVTLNPGDGGFIKAPAGRGFTVTFVGEVLQGRLTNQLPAGLAIRSSMVPQAGRVTTDLSFPASRSDFLYKWLGGGYDAYFFDPDDDEWTPQEPTVAVGEAFFIRKLNAANWVRNFTVQ